MRAALRQALVDLAADLHQHPDQMGDVAARVVDVGLQQDGVARRLVELDVVAARQQSLELRAVEAGGPAHQRHARGIEAELVLLQAAPCRRPIRLRIEVIGEAAFAILRRHHLVGAEDVEILGDQRMFGDRLPDGECDLDGIVHEAVTLQLHLPARHVQAGNQLLVRAGRSVGEHGLVELRFHGVEIDVLDEAASSPAAAPTSTCASSSSDRRAA